MLNWLFNYINYRFTRLQTKQTRSKIGKIEPSATIKNCHIIGGQYISIKANTLIQDCCILTAFNHFNSKDFTPSIEIGCHCNIGEENHITAIDQIKIGNGVLTGRRVTISDNNHGRFCIDDLKLEPMKRELYSKGPVTIGDNVWIGENACILSGVTIGEGSIIGAGSIVTKDVPPYSLACGVPAKVLKTLKP